MCGWNADFSNVTADGMCILYWTLKDWVNTVPLILCHSSSFCKIGQFRSENKNSWLRNTKRIISQFATTQHGVKSQLTVTVTPLLESIFFPHRGILHKFKYSLIRYKGAATTGALISFQVIPTSVSRSGPQSRIDYGWGKPMSLSRSSLHRGILRFRYHCFNSDFVSWNCATLDTNPWKCMREWKWSCKKYFPRDCIEIMVRFKHRSLCPLQSQ